MRFIHICHVGNHNGVKKKVLQGSKGLTDKCFSVGQMQAQDQQKGLAGALGFIAK